MPAPRDTYFKDPDPSSRQVRFMIPETEGEWPLVQHPKGKRWRTKEAAKTAKKTLAKYNIPVGKQLSVLGRNIAECNRGDTDTEDQESAKPLSTPVQSTTTPDETMEKIRHYAKWTSSTQRAMHEGHPMEDKVYYHFHKLMIISTFEFPKCHQFHLTSLWNKIDLQSPILSLALSPNDSFLGLM